MIYVNGLGLLLAFVSFCLFGGYVASRSFLMLLASVGVLLIDLVVRAVATFSQDKRQRDPFWLFTPSLGGHVGYVPCWIWSFALVAIFIGDEVLERARAGPPAQPAPEQKEPEKKPPTKEPAGPPAWVDVLGVGARKQPGSDKVEEVDVDVHSWETALVTGLRVKLEYDLGDGTWVDGGEHLPGEMTKNMHRIITLRLGRVPKRVRIKGTAQVGGFARRIESTWPDPRFEGGPGS
jgi:hypothetical protein